MIMTQEQKELLFKDLCARLPYGVKIELTWWVMNEGTCMSTTLEPDHIEQIRNDELGDVEIKPYLFPMSSMTEEQQINLTKFVENGIHGENILYDWLNKNHFDYRYLIDKGLAIPPKSSLDAITKLIFSKDDEK